MCIIWRTISKRSLTVHLLINSCVICTLYLHILGMFLPCCLTVMSMAHYCLTAGVFGVVYDGYLSNAEDEPEGTTPVIVKTVKGESNLVTCSSSQVFSYYIMWGITNVLYTFTLFTLINTCLYLGLLYSCRVERASRNDSYHTKDRKTTGLY